MNIEQKRKEFLEKLDKAFGRLRIFLKFVGPGFGRKIGKLFFTPHIYLPYGLKKLNIKNSDFVDAKLFYGKKIRLQMIDDNAFAFYFFGLLIDEYKLTKFFIKNLKEDDVFYDIGANEGFYTYLAAEFCKETHSFEPTPNVFENLKLNLSHNKNIFLNNIALSNESGETFLYLANSSGPNTIIDSVARVRNYDGQK
jgi:hypothetical protein